MKELLCVQINSKIFKPRNVVVMVASTLAVPHNSLIDHCHSSVGNKESKGLPLCQKPMAVLAALPWTRLKWHLKQPLTDWLPCWTQSKWMQLASKGLRHEICSFQSSNNAHTVWERTGTMTKQRDTGQDGLLSAMLVFTIHCYFLPSQ